MQGYLGRMSSKVPKRNLRIDERAAFMRKVLHCLTFSGLMLKINLDMEMFSSLLFGTMVDVLK